MITEIYTETQLHELESMCSSWGPNDLRALSEYNAQVGLEARMAVPYLIAEIRRLRREVEFLQKENA